LLSGYCCASRAAIALSSAFADASGTPGLRRATASKLWLVRLAVLAVLMSVVSLYYYIRFIRAMYIESETEPQPVIIAPPLRVALGVAAVLVLYALGFGAAAGAVGLAIVLPTWAAVLIVGAVFAAAAGVVFLTGRKAMRTAPKVEQTRETLKEDVRWAKQQIAR